MLTNIARLPFYQEFMHRQGLASNMGCIIASDELLTSAVSFQRDIGRELFHPDDIDASAKLARIKTEFLGARA